MCSYDIWKCTHPNYYEDDRMCDSCEEMQKDMFKAKDKVEHIISLIYSTDHDLDIHELDRAFASLCMDLNISLEKDLPQIKRSIRK